VTTGPFVSVIIPTYQCAPYLACSISSVLSQTYPQDKIETIVVNDGSTDDTDQAMQPFLERVRYHKQVNRGVAAARNVGVATARGDYLAFLDADDYWYPDRLEQLVGAVQRDNLITSDFVIDVGGTLRQRGYYAGHDLYANFEKPANEQYLLALENNFIAWPMIPKRVFERVGPFDEGLVYGEDWDLWLRCLASGYAVRLVRKVCAVYRYRRPGATTTRHDLRMAENRLVILERHRRNVSPQRWRMAKGVLSHLQLRQSLELRHYGGAARHALGLGLNWTYMRRWFKNRSAQRERQD